MPLFRTFASEFAAKYDMSFRGFTDDAEELLLSYRWPGNIRELKNVAEQLIVLEKSQTVDKERLQKYLKGRQHLGSTDHLPSVHATDYQGGYQQRDEFHTGHNDHASEFQFLLKAMLDVRTEIAELKRMMANVFMGTWNQPQSSYTPALPAPQAHPIDPNDLTSHLRPSDRPSINPEDSSSDSSNDDHSENVDSSDSLLGGKAPEDPMEYLRSAQWEEGDFPSLEALERTVIERALETFEGNRRKASTALGISERTLYRKIDQYGLDS